VVVDVRPIVAGLYPLAQAVGRRPELPRRAAEPLGQLEPRVGVWRAVKFCHRRSQRVMQDPAEQLNLVGGERARVAPLSMLRRLWEVHLSGALQPPTTAWGERPYVHSVRASLLYGAAPAEKTPRITKRIDAALRSFDQEKLDHLPPALYFERHQDDLLETLDESTLERANKLFERVNSQLTL
jgi:hypothetical protein